LHAFKLYFVAEELVFWASLRFRRWGSETNGPAVNSAASGSGMMEFWNVGIMGLV